MLAPFGVARAHGLPISSANLSYAQRSLQLGFRLTF